MVKTLCIIQSRLTSTRLPNKVLMLLGQSQKTIVEHVYERLSLAKNIDKIVFAIPDTTANDKLALFLTKKNYEFYRGSEENVLSRFYNCAIKYGSETIVRATCDNPFVDWILADKMIDSIGKADYITCKSAPLGTGVEVFSFDSLKEAYNNAKLPIELEHVTPYIWKRMEKFKCIDYPIIAPKYRLTIDEEKDFELANILYKELYNGTPILNTDIYTFMNMHKNISNINSDVQQNNV